MRFNGEWNFAIHFIVATLSARVAFPADDPHMEHQPRILLTLSTCVMQRQRAQAQRPRRKSYSRAQARRYIGLQRSVKDLQKKRPIRMGSAVRTTTCVVVGLQRVFLFYLITA